MITTIKGPMDESTLRRVDGQYEDGHELTNWIEYYDGEELVHRSVHVHLKEGLPMFGEQGEIGG